MDKWQIKPRTPNPKSSGNKSQIPTVKSKPPKSRKIPKPVNTQISYLSQILHQLINSICTTCVHAMYSTEYSFITNWHYPIKKKLATLILKGTLHSVEKPLIQKAYCVYYYILKGDFFMSINSVVDFSLNFKWDWHGRCHFSSFIYGVTSLVSEW